MTDATASLRYIRKQDKTLLFILLNGAFFIMLTINCIEESTPYYVYFHKIKLLLILLFDPKYILNYTVFYVGTASSINKLSLG